jgi:pilus assembly protein CpaC
LVIDQVSRGLQDYLRKRIKDTFPTAVVTLTVANRSTAILEGYVERAEQVQPIVDLVRSFLASNVGAAPDAVTVVNALRVTGATSVQLKVIIAEVERTKSRDLGFDWNAIFSTNPSDTGGVSTSTGSFINRRVNGGIGLSSADSSNSNINFFVTQNGINVFEGFLRALVENNLGKLLAEPVLTTTSGQPAYFNVGGETPILLPQGNGTISIEYRDFGTNLRFVPTILGDGRIRLEVRPEVSELNPGLAVTASGLSVPGFTTRLAETTVELESGQSFAIAGLIQKRVRATTRKIPVMGDIPAVGWLFQNKTYRQTDTELLIIVTPHLVDALDQRPCELPGRESRIPNDIEFYLGSKFEPPCFGDPYRGHIKNWHQGLPSPTPVPVRPYDNYGQPIDSVPIEAMPSAVIPAPAEDAPPSDIEPTALMPVPSSPVEVAPEPEDLEEVEAFPAPRSLPPDDEIEISLVPAPPSETAPK